MKITVKISSDKAIEQVINKPVVLVGRSPKCDFVVANDALSRRHCQVELENGQFYVTDLESANGVFIDGVKIPPSKKVPFNTFLQLSLGPLDTQISDTDDRHHASPYVSPTPIETPEALTRPTRKINAKALNDVTDPKGRSPNAKKEGASKNGFTASLIIFAAVIGYFGWVLLNEEPKVVTKIDPKVGKTSAAKKDQVTPKLLKLAPDAFLTGNEYLAKLAARSCQADAATLCSNLSLSENEDEGLVKEESEYFVIMKPSKLAGLQEYATIKNNPNRDSLIAFYLLIKSNLFYSLMGRSFSQIHLLILNSEKKPMRVYRVHLNTISSGFDRGQALKDLVQAIKTNNPDLFWSKYKNTFPSQDIL